MSSAPDTLHRPIRRLPELLVNQIAAGEVVDRPASVVKELVENAIDAGATRVTLELEQGGIELVRITDDGAGIPAAELPLALATHSTSKIRTAEDLDRIATMGFRGEAIASIASVSRLSIRSRSRATEESALRLLGVGEADGTPGAPRTVQAPSSVARSESASVIEVEGNRVSPVKPTSGPFGTCVTVRNLFFNTPARRKFLRTPATEQGHCVDIFSTIAIAHPALGFAATCDGKTVLDLPPGQGPRDRALAVLGKELADQLLEVNADKFDDARGLTLWGLIGRPAIARATAKSQYLFLNGRAIRDKTIQHAVREAYRGLIEPGRYPTAVLMIEMDPGAVDVNVHPAKAEVRFRDQSMVHGVVLRAVRDALRAADLTPVVSSAWALRGGGSGASPMFGSGEGSSAGGSDRPFHTSPSAGPEALVEYLKRPLRQIEPVSYEALREAVAEPTRDASPAIDQPNPLPLPSGKGGEVALVSQPRRESLLQVHNSYVVTEDEQGLVIVDQHALHERVMFEALMLRITSGPLESQRMLVPAVVRLTGAQLQRLDDLKPLLDKIGVALEPLGPDSAGVQSFPTFLFDRDVDPAEFVSDLFEKAEGEDFAPGSEAALHEVLDMMACKAAVKAGDRLTDTELGDLLRLRDFVERSSNCPHGRPTSIRLTIRELEKRFGRT